MPQATAIESPPDTTPLGPGGHVLIHAHTPQGAPENQVQTASNVVKTQLFTHSSLATHGGKDCWSEIFTWYCLLLAVGLCALGRPPFSLTRGLLLSPVPSFASRQLPSSTGAWAVTLPSLLLILGSEQAGSGVTCASQEVSAVTRVNLKTILVCFQGNELGGGSLTALSLPGTSSFKSDASCSALLSLKPVKPQRPPSPHP